MLSSPADAQGDLASVPPASRSIASGCCHSVRTVAPPAVSASVITWEEKLGWIVRLEDQRILRDPNPPPQVVLSPRRQREPAIVAPPTPSDLIRAARRQRGRASVAARRWPSAASAWPRASSR